MESVKSCAPVYMGSCPPRFWWALVTTALSVLLPGPQAPADAFVRSPASPGPFSVGASSPAPRKSLQPPFIPVLWSVSVQTRALPGAGLQRPTQSRCVGRVESSP